MGIRYSKRIGANKGWGINVSGSGISSSYRSKYGSIGSKGFSMKSGIPGLTFRSSWGRGKNKGATALIMLAIVAAMFFAYITAVVFYNVARLPWWIAVELYHFSLRLYYKRREKREQKQSIHLEDTEKTAPN